MSTPLDEAEETDRATTGPGSLGTPPASEHPAPTPRRRRAADRPATISARRAVALVAASLGVLALLRAPNMVHTGEGMPPGHTRDLVLGLARPLDSVTRPLGLDWPGERLSEVFGHRAPAATSELLTATAAPAPPTRAPAHLPTPAAVPPPPARVPTAEAPLRVLVTGDSLTESLGPTIVNTAPATVRAQTDTRYGTGLVRPDFFDWAAHAREQVASRDPEVVVVAMGANDGQGITMPDGTILAAGSPPWVAEYQRRVEVVLRIWADGGKRRVYWVSLPPARSDRLNGYFHQLNGAAAAATRQVPGTRYLDLSSTLSVDGHYSDYLRDAGGHTVSARTRDGVHYTLDGARIVAAPVLAALGTDFRLTGPPAAAPARPGR